MKFLKTKNISRFSISDNTIISYPIGTDGKYSRVVIDAVGGLMLPKGPTSDRPKLTGVRQPTDARGTIRYNTTNDTIEAWIGPSGLERWETVRAPGSTAITKTTLTPVGDDTETVFGPLPTSSIPASADNILVFVENVFQISTTNFTLEQSVSGSLTGPNAPYSDGWYLKFTSPVPFGKYVTVYFGFAN